MPSFLPSILESRRTAVARARDEMPEPELRQKAVAAPPPRDFHGALAQPGMSLIAEFKRASPSKGELNLDMDPAGQAAAYERGGAQALSVLTEPEFFKGSAGDLTEARNATSLPVLWKDFVIDPYQVALARAYGADAVLLIVRILDYELFCDLLGAVELWGMTALVEVFDEGDLARALEAGAHVVGVNHRDLETFEEDTAATSRLRPLVPPGVAFVAESGISSRADVAALEAMAVDAVLVGEALVRAPDPAAKVRELLGT